MGRTFAVGDLQGCKQPLLRLLDKVNFDPSQDQLWCVGDLVNRGPDSLGTLQFLYSIRDSLKIVLGNHDLHLLAVAFGQKQVKKDSDLIKICESPDADVLLSWLRQQPLFYRDKKKKLAMSHAGIPPFWSLKMAQGFSDEVQAILQSERHIKLYQTMYGDTPEVWRDSLVGWDRLRCIVNYFTRMRLIGPQYQLDLANKLAPQDGPNGYKAWFDYPTQFKKTRFLFGHWAALNGLFDHTNVIGLDTGCVWGGPLTMLHVESGKYYQKYL